MKKVSTIFKKKPEKWGFRGDPYFWEYLEKLFDNYELPFDYDELEKIIKEEHLKLTGIELTEKSIGKCEKIEHGGMTSDGICGGFWITEALPLLKERLNKKGLFTKILKKEKKNFKNYNKQVISFGNGCVVSKKIFDENYKIGCMKRDIPSGDYPDSGWRFFVGDEDETYTNNSNNMQIYSLESMVEYDGNIEKYLNSPNGSEFIRINERDFIEDDGRKIYITKKVKIKEETINNTIENTIEQLKTDVPTLLEKLNLNVENIYKNCKLNTIADYFMFDKFHENWWNKNIYIHDNQQGDRCAIEFGDEYTIGVFFAHEMYNDIQISNFFEHVPKDIYEKAQSGVLQYMLIDDNNPKITTMFFVKNNETYSIHKKEIFIKNGGWLISEISYKEMLEEISDDCDCSREDLRLIEEIYNKIAEAKNQKIRLEDKTINSMHGKITKERIENFWNIDIIISNKHIITECNNNADSTMEKYTAKKMTIKSKLGYVLLMSVITQLIIFVLFGVLDEMPLFLGIIFFLLIPTNIVLFIVYIAKKLDERFARKNEINKSKEEIEQQKREKQIQKSVKNMLSEDTYNKLKKLYIGELDIIFFERENIDAGQIGFRYTGFFNEIEEIIDEWPGNEYVIIGYDSTDGCGPDPYIMKTDEKELPIYWLMTDGGDWKNPAKIANSFDDFIKIIDCLNKNLNSEHEPNMELLLNEIEQINSNENMWYWQRLLESIISNED